MKLYSPLGELLHRLCYSYPPMDTRIHYGPVADESEPRVAAAKARSKYDRRIFLSHRYVYKILADSARLTCVLNEAVEGANRKPG